MIEEGIVALVQAALDGYVPPVPGGFFAQLPKDLISPTCPLAWTYQVVSATPEYTLSEGPEGFVPMTMQITCHGQFARDAIRLAAKIDEVLSGYHGTLPDPDATVVQGIFNEGSAHDGFSDINRSFVRSNDYQINYCQP